MSERTQELSESECKQCGCTHATAYELGRQDERLASNSEISNLEARVVETATAYIKVQDDWCAADKDAPVPPFAEMYDAYCEAARALIAARERVEKEQGNDI